MFRALASLATLCVVVACTTQLKPVKTALSGDLKALKADILEAQAQGKLNRAALAELSWAVAGREIRAATGQQAAERIRKLQSCARPLSSVLEERAERTDEIGAEATLLLVQSGQLEPEPLFERYRNAESGAFRAVAARSATNPESAGYRRKFISDPDQRVRRAALHAALIAEDPGEIDVLLEAARLDPDPLSRSLATRAAAKVGLERAIMALKDLFHRAEETERLTIVEAWAQPKAQRHGGERELTWVVETQNGPPAIAAGHALLKAGPELRELGAQVLARYVEHGTEMEKRLAITFADLSHADIKRAVWDAKNSANPEVQVMAWARLLDHPPEQARAQQALQKLARMNNDIAVQARAALSTIGDLSIVDALEDQLSSRRQSLRRTAARSLVRLGAFAEAAPALADDHPDVRAEIACLVLRETSG